MRKVIGICLVVLSIAGCGGGGGKSGNTTANPFAGTPMGHIQVPRMGHGARLSTMAG
ncbi:MAG: hypothetical protein GX139_09710 [Armatimonadetes bacterium]|nr:hypothetical protein [Armatimonadota bacterium]